MSHESIPLLTQYLRRLTNRYGDPATDQEMLQRFVACHEETAFVGLVERHAAMVLGLCRSILRNHHDAEDIFQAVFLVLARKAGSIRKGESVGSWLYAVTHRLAHKARIRAGKRHERVQRAEMPLEQTPMDEVSWGELRDILHEEVSRLPEKYRAAVVLCYWEGQTHEQAGQQLGCAKSTIKDRLEKAREMLRTRLARRGLALPAAWFAASLSEGTSVAVSLELAQTTVRGAMLFSLGQLSEGVLSVNAVACAKSAVQAMLLSKLKYGLAFVLMLGVLGGAGLAVLQEGSAPGTPAEQPKAAALKNEPEALATEEPLPAGAVARLGTLRFRHGDPIRRIAIGTDGTSILSAAGKAVYVWDLAIGKERRRFEHQTLVTSFVCSSDGKVLASVCQDETIHLWDVDSGRELPHSMDYKAKKPSPRQPVRVHVLGFTPDDRLIVSEGPNKAIRILDTKSGESIRAFGGFAELAWVSSSPDGKTLVGAVKDDKTWELRLWEVTTGRVLKRQPQLAKKILSVVHSPDGKMLAVSVGEDDWQKPCDIQLLDAQALKEIRNLRGHKSWASGTFSPDGKTLVSAGDGNGARLWDVATGKETARIGDNVWFFNQILFCSDGQTLVSFTQNNHVLRFWDRASGKEVRSSEDARSPIDFLSFSPDSRSLATGSKTDWDFRLWDVAARKKLRRLEHGCLFALQFAPDGKRLATAAFKDTQARIWDAVSGKELRRITASKDIDCMTWSPDGKLLATWSYQDAPIRLWNSERGEQISELSAKGYEIGSLVFSPDGKTLAALGMESRVQGKTLILLWTVDTRKQLPSIETPISFVNYGSFGYPRLAFSPDGRTLAAGGPGAKASIYLWEAATGRRRLTLDHGADVDALAFSPDGKLLAAAINLNYYNQMIALPGMVNLRAGNTSRPRVHLWDILANKELPPLEAHPGAITALSFSPDGKLLATGGNDTTVLLWDATRFKPSRPAEVKRNPEQLESLWADLDCEDAVKAYYAIRTLAAAPKSSVAFLKQRLQPVNPAEAKQAAGLIDDLDSDQFAVREKAMQQLAKLGDRAATELHKALTGKASPEVKRRIEQLLLKQNGVNDIRMIRALETLEYIGTAEARDLCAALADGVPDAPLTREAQATLRRMAR
jgi:RNA polymerase sigma factor (sigma-70 family)